MNCLLTQSEESFQRMLANGLRSGRVADIYGWPPVIDVAVEVYLGRSRTDIMVTHADGSVTLIECKRAGLGLREYLTGLGQVIYAGSQYGSSLMATGQTRQLRLALAVPDGVQADLGFACLDAGVEYMPCGSVAELNAATLAGWAPASGGAQWLA